MGMAKSVKDIHAETFIKKYAWHLQKQGKIKNPHFFEYSKTASAREFSPLEPNWWYIRVASIARRIYIKKGLGVGHFRDVFGGSHRRGAKPAHHARASGNIVRKCLQQLEQIGIIQKT